MSMSMSKEEEEAKMSKQEQVLIIEPPMELSFMGPFTYIVSHLPFLFVFHHSYRAL